jgi:putative ABC transport system substrate-binding protein
MPASADPIGAGLVQSLARPGGNITGSTFISSELAAKRLEVLKQLAPRTKVVAVLANPGNPAGALQLRQAQSAAGGLGVRLTLVEVGADTALAAAFAHVARDRAEAVLVVDDPVLGDKRLDIIRHIDAARLPAIYGWRDWVDAGGLVSLGANVDDMFRRAAGYVDRILKGARPADLPIEQPTIFEFVINLKTAKALGLTIPPSVLARVDQVIE